MSKRLTPSNLLVLAPILYILLIISISLILVAPPSMLTLDLIIYVVSCVVILTVAVYTEAKNVKWLVSSTTNTKYLGFESIHNPSSISWRIAGSNLDLDYDISLPLLVLGTLGLAYPLAMAMLYLYIANTMSMLCNVKRAWTTEIALILASLGLLAWYYLSRVYNVMNSCKVVK